MSPLPRIALAFAFTLGAFTPSVAEITVSGLVEPGQTLTFTGTFNANDYAWAEVIHEDYANLKIRVVDTYDNPVYFENYLYSSSVEWWVYPSMTYRVIITNIGDFRTKYTLSAKSGPESYYHGDL